MEKTADYYKLQADEICQNVLSTNQNVISSEVEGIKFVVLPHVYPSHRFRTTGFVLKCLQPLLKGKSVCDMGCGPGIVGLFALHNGAKRVIQADINPYAIANAKENNLKHGFTDPQIATHQSNCFEGVPEDSFDLIVFNMPYHCDKIDITEPLQHAFYDPDFVSITTFLNQAIAFSHEKTQIFIAFSNKGDVQRLEAIFDDSPYTWKLWKVTNTNQEYDNRIYLLS